MRRFLPTAALAIAALLCASPAANAANATVVSLAQCARDDGTITVPQGAPITIQSLGYAEGSYGLIQNFLLKQRTTLTLSDGTSAVYDLTRKWDAPQPLGNNLWITNLPPIPTGIALAAGDSVVATFDITFPQPLLVAFPPVTSSGANGPFLIGEEGPVSCMITGAGT